MVTAFGIAPGAGTSDVALTVVREPIELPEMVRAVQESQRYVSQERVLRGDTVAALFERLGVSDPKALEFLKSDATGRMIYRQLVPGRMLQAETGVDGELLALRYFVSSASLLEANRTPEGIKTRQRALTDAPRLVYKAATIRSSLFAATDSADSGRDREQLARVRPRHRLPHRPAQGDDSRSLRMVSESAS